LFGDEGKKMEKTWLMSAGVRKTPILLYKVPNLLSSILERYDTSDAEGFTYPHPTPKTEKWRYENMLVCKEALSQVYDPKHKIQSSYKEWLADTQHDLEAAIANVAAPEAVLARSTECQAIILEAAKMWVDFGKERYRIVMAMPSDIQSEITKKRDQDHDIELLVEPELVRFGNSKGEELQRPEQRVTEPSKSYVLRGY
jgi:hypothetical protein